MTNKSKFQCVQLDCENPIVKWEYLVIDDSSGCNPDSYEELNFLGQKGWELTALKKDAITGSHIWYFKRQISNGRVWHFKISNGQESRNV